MQLKYFISIILISTNIYLFAQSENKTVNDSSACVEVDPILEQLNAVNETWYAKKVLYHETSQAAFACKDIPTNDVDSIMYFRLKAITDETLFPLVYNNHIRNYIDLYTRRYKSLSLLLGFSKYYFPMFEEALDRYNCPLELKYLAVIESALNPTAVSRAGATGLWQFMYNTGKMYDLQVSTWVDDRRDPLKATEAAAKHLRDLSEMFWGDWVLAIAAYNCGPGNVTKAIQRSGGKTDFWEIYNYLPSETRGYVPAFYGAMYAMKYYDKYGITPADVKFDLTDTIHITNKLHFQQIAAVINIPVETLIMYNPQYKRNVIPAANQTLLLSLPVEYISSFIAHKDSIYNYNTHVYFPSGTISEAAFASADEATSSGKYKYHTVKRGESLSIIARRYGISLSELSRMNNRKSTMIHPGDKLIVGYIKVSVEKKTTPSDAKPTLDTASLAIQNTDSLQQQPKDTLSVPTLNKESNILEDNTSYIVYKVGEGDTLWSISKRFQSASVEEIRKINNMESNERLTVGKTLRIPK